MEIPGAIYFAGQSRMWNGGTAFYEARGNDAVAARAYLITMAQFSDVAAQEVRRPPGVDLELTGIGSNGRALGPGGYETVVGLGCRQGLPMVAITAGERADQTPVPPSWSYLRTIVAGLREAHRWSPARIGAYLFRAPGVAVAWTPEQIAELADEG
jgi:hypothetical protein